jgi:hypothetical protein
MPHKPQFEADDPIFARLAVAAEELEGAPTVERDATLLEAELAPPRPPRAAPRDNARPRPSAFPPTPPRPRPREEARAEDDDRSETASFITPSRQGSVVSLSLEKQT